MNKSSTPDVRDAQRNLLYDSTTDSMDDTKRDSTFLELYIQPLNPPMSNDMLIVCALQCMLCTMMLKRIQTTCSNIR